MRCSGIRVRRTVSGATAVAAVAAHAGGGGRRAFLCRHIASGRAACLQRQVAGIVPGLRPRVHEGRGDEWNWSRQLVALLALAGARAMVGRFFQPPHEAALLAYHEASACASSQGHPFPRRHPPRDGARCELAPRCLRRGAHGGASAQVHDGSSYGLAAGLPAKKTVLRRQRSLGWWVWAGGTP